MASYRSGNKKKLLEVSCEEFNLTFSGCLEDRKSTALRYNLNTPATLVVNGEYENQVNIKYATDEGILATSYGSTMAPRFFEHGLYEVILERLDKSIDIIHMESDFHNGIQEYGGILLGNIEFNSEIGYSTFAIRKNGLIILSITIEVFPSKLDYKKDYDEIMDDINNEISALAFEFLGKTYLKTKLVDTNNQTNTEFINILKVIFDGLEINLRRICSNLKHNVETVEEVKRVEKSRITSRKTIDYIRKHPNSLLEDDKGFIEIDYKKYIPSTVINKRKKTTTDIFENRLVKYMILSIIRRLGIIERNIISRYKENNHYIDFIHEKKVVLQGYVKRYFSDISDLNGKRTMSLVFQMSPGYKELYKKYQMLKKGLGIADDLYKITPKKLYNLYEMWCYIKINSILKSLGYDIKEHGIIQANDNGLYISLVQEEKAKMVYSNGNKTLELWYNKIYEGLPTTNQKPDTVLCIKNTDKNDVVYLFDAKYRVNVTNEVGPMEEDINVMHRYRDSIVSSMDESMQFKYDTFGAYVMFPYADENKFKNHNFYKSIEKVNIGAFPMLPGSTKLITEHLKKIIGQSTIEAKANRVLVDEMDNCKMFREENVIVVVVPSNIHYKAYKQNKFYHIPKKTLSNVKLGIKYVAIYKPISNFGEYAGIDEYAEILNIRTYKRKECTELEVSKRSNGEDEYLRFELGEFIKINKVGPIQSGIRNNWYTTLYLLKNAENLHELKFKSSFEVKVYRKLLEVSEELNIRIKKENGCYTLNNKKVQIEDGNKIRVNGELRGIDQLRESIK